MNPSRDETLEEKTFRIFTTVFGDREETLEDSMSDPYFRITCKAVAMAIAEEREACAQVASRQMDDEPYGHAKFRCGNITDAIRARGAAPKEGEEGNDG